MSSLSPWPSLAIIPLLLAVPAQAQNNPSIPELEHIVVTPGRVAQLESEVLGDLTIIDGQELQRAGQDSLAQILNRHHGLSFYDQGGPQTVTGVSIRGANPTQTLLMIDGIPVNSATSGLGSFNAIPPASVERVEVLRGAASSLYGANAVGGVINVITIPETGEPLTARAATGFGSHGTSRSSAGLAGRSGAWTYSLAGSYDQSRGYDATRPDAPFGAHNPDRDSYYSRSLRGSAGYEWLKDQKLTVQFYDSRINGGFDQGDFAPYDDIRAVQSLSTLSLTSDNRLTDFWSSSLRYAYTEDENKTVYDLGAEVFRSRQNQISWQNEFRLDERQNLVLAYEHLNQRVSGDIPDFFTGGYEDFDQTRRHNNAYTAVYRGDFDRLHLQASARTDRDSQFGSAHTWGLSSGFDITPELRIHAAANTGFRIPTFNDLYYPGFANPDLSPERSRNIEAGLTYTGETMGAGVVAYRNRIHDLITFDPVLGLPNNIGKATIRGLTLTAWKQWGNTRLDASVDLQDPHNDTEDKQLNRRARQTLRLALQHDIGPWSLGTEFQLVGKRYDDVQNTVRLGGYGLWNLSAAYQLTDAVNVSVRWNNVLDKDYMNAYGYNTPGSNVFVNLAWRM